jgi:hypothetical protein
MIRRSSMQVLIITVFLALFAASCSDNGGSAVTPSVQSWGTAKIIQLKPTENSDAPAFAMNASGNGMAVWQQSDGVTASNIWSSRYDAASGWGPATLVESDNSALSTRPEVAIDRDGNAVAVWLDSDAVLSISRVWANRCTPASGWGTPTIISTDGGGDASFPRVAMDGGGNAMVVWSQSDGTTNRVRANRYVRGFGWGLAWFVNSGLAFDAQVPRVAMDVAGNTMVVWVQSDGTRLNAWANRYAAGWGWGTPACIQAAGTVATEDVKFPRIAMNGAGDATAVWNQGDGSTFHVWASRYSAGSGSWGSATLLSPADAGEDGYARVSMDDAGNAMAVWRQAGVVYSVYASRFLATGPSWENSVLLETDDSGDAGSPEVAMDGAGNATAVWAQFDGVTTHPRANRYTAGSGWGKDVRIDNASDEVQDLLAVAAGGVQAAAVWVQSDGTAWNTRANSFR